MPLRFYDTPPYYDDFDKTKNYQRILFRPGFAVQARELTQLQTALQAQIDRFGQHVFADGSQVLGGQASLDSQFAYVKLESTFTDSAVNYNADNYASEALPGKVLTGLMTGITAVVLDLAPVTTDDPLTVFVKYTSSGTDNVTQVFATGEILTFSGAASVTRKFKVKATAATGFGCRVSVNEGVFFVAGNFVYTPGESIILAKYDDRPSARVVYRISEGIISSAEDATLTDNALGSPNAAAPGAHRYQIVLDLITQGIEFADRTENNIIQLLVIRDGLVAATARTSYSELGDILAQRTFEESGNYAVRPFQINIREYLNDGTNGGLYTPTQIVAAGNAADNTEAGTFGAERLAVGLEPSVAYVNGYRIEIEETKYVPVLKARDEGYFNAASILGALGNYITIDNLVGLPDVNDFGQITLKNVGTTTIGTARARSLEYVSGTIGTTGAIYKLYLFDIQMNSGQAFSSVDNLYHSYGSGAAFTADVTDAVIHETANNSLVYKLPVDAIQTLRTEGGLIDALYYVKKKYDNRTTDGASVVTITATTDEIFDSTSNQDWIAVTSAGVVKNPASIVIGGGGTTATLTFTATASTSMYIIAPTRRNLREKIKNFTASSVAIASPNTTPGAYDSLSVTDLFAIHSIHMSSGMGTAATTGDPDILNRYTIDNGQRDNFYDVARIQLRSDAVAPTGQLLVVMDWFTHQPGDYFSVDSYAGQIDYALIPAFQSSKGLIQLRDAIDFRPTINNAGTGFTGTGSSSVSMIKPNSIFTTDIQYFLPRVDKIFVDKRGNFGVLQGISTLNPIEPEDPKDAMVLYTIRLGAYTFGTRDIVPSMVDNKRYTMRDIGKIDKRVSKLEYYTSLSLLEHDTAGTQIFDVSNNVRYKNGFVVDSFYGSNVGAIMNPDYSVSTDKAAGKLRPLYNSDNVRLKYDAAGSTDMRKTGPLLTLNYYQADYIQQPYSSLAENVNPYNVFSWAGEVKLSPEMDEWKETDRRPDVVIDQAGIYDALTSLVDESSAIGTVWNEWQTNWTGVIGQSSSTNVNNDWSSFQQTSTTTLTTTTQVDQTRTGIRTSVVPDTVTTSVGDRVLEVNFVPFIRSRKIYFRATRLKPNTTVYAFFDNSDISDFVREESYVEYSDAENVENYLDETDHPAGASALITDAAGTVEGSFVIPNTPTLKFKTGSRIFRLTDSSTNDPQAAITYAEAIYNASGLLETKENLVISTRVPTIQRTEVSDARVVTGVASSSTSVVTALQRPPAAPPAAVIPSNSTTGIFSPPGWSTPSVGAPRYLDPLAQTFLADMQGGIFATSLDLFFKTKDTDIPVTIQLRTVENGIPTQRVVPFSQVTLNAADVDVSDDASVATTFTFTAPVHLIQSVEYCFVIMSNSDQYTVWVSELGGYDVTNTAYRITKQPYNGVMFKSQNASTWTPEQTKDIKFTLRRASFTESGTASFTEIDLPLAGLANDPISTTNASNSVRIFHKNHGHFPGSSKVTLSGILATSGSTLNNIPITQLNATHTVQTCEIDSYTVTVATNANATGRAGGNGVAATQNRVMNVFQPIVQQVVIPDTDLQWSARLTSGQSLAGSETPHTVSDYVKIKVNDNTYLSRPQAVVSQPNYTLLSSGSKSFMMKGEMVTARNNLSPVIDLDRLSLITVSNRIDNPAASPASGFNAVSNFIPETTAIGGSALAKYITRKVELNDPASALNVYVLVNRPSGTGIAVYYKVLANGSDANFDTLAWVLASPDTAIPTSDDQTSYSEIQYTVSETDLASVEFTAFAVKIVLTSENSSSVPTCRDFRAIAVT